MSSAASGEFDLIARYFAPIAAAFPGALGLKDDVALFDPPAGSRLVVTADAMVAGVHFLADDPPDLIARKLMRVNLSDLAAKGATPYACLLTLSLPKGTDEGWVAAFAKGLAMDAAEYRFPLAGGDTTSTPGPLCLSLTAVGLMAEGRAPLLRSGAKAGDAVFVTGTIGDAHLGLAVQQGEFAGLAADHRAALIERYRLPQPRVAFGQALAGISGVHAAADVSDGLIADLGHICAASNLSAIVEAARIPHSAAAQAALEIGASGERLLTGGDDYEIVFTAAPEAEAAIAAAAKQFNVKATPIGRTAAGQGVTAIDAIGNAISLLQKGYRHF
ncbi:MAG TPA: thiamine-phosphate kinase [Alphaproteobacteria bacterium]|nr:thiamine-phosphate kinase [Alphaproteobacteria bacterium]